MTYYDFNVSRFGPKDQRLIYEFGREMNFNIKQKGRKSNKDKSLIKLLKPPAIIAGSIRKQSSSKSKTPKTKRIENNVSTI